HAAGLVDAVAAHLPRNSRISVFAPREARVDLRVSPMRAAVFNKPRSISVTDRPDAAIAEPTDAVVRVVLACVCGSDLWYYRGDTVAVVGDGAVGLCGVLAAERIGAERIIALSRNPVRQQLAREFGATDILEQRGEQATNAVMELTDGVGADATLECVGTGQA